MACFMCVSISVSFLHMGLTQLLAQYAPVLFSQAGLSSTTSAFLASGVSGLLNIACTIITQIFTDKCTP